MRSKIIKKAHKRDDFKLTSHNFLLCIRLELIDEYFKDCQNYSDIAYKFLEIIDEIDISNQD